MSKTTLTLGYAIGEVQEEQNYPGRDYTLDTNEKLAGDNATPMPAGDVACVGFKLPRELRKPTIADGVAFRQCMADQGDDEDRLSLSRR
jgi:hypothetical protein